jgi:hypothetical protein
MAGKSVLQIGKSTAGGLIFKNTTDGTTGLNALVVVQNFPICVVLARVQGHGKAPHSGASEPKMVQSSSKVFVRRRGVCRVGDLASCGDAGINGATQVFAG